VRSKVTVYAMPRGGRPDSAKLALRISPQAAAYDADRGGPPYDGRDDFEDLADIARRRRCNTSVEFCLTPLAEHRASDAPRLQVDRDRPVGE
jgi:hypothetical protein